MKLEQSEGSAQLRRFRSAIAQGRSLVDAVEIAGDGFTIDEGRATLADDAKNPPHATAPHTKEIDDMAPKKSGGKVADPLGDLGAALAADHTLDKAKAAPETKLDPTALFAKAPDAKAEGVAALDKALDNLEDSVLESDAPGWDKQLDKVVNLVLDAEFESGTLVGDLVDAMLTAIRQNPKGWSHMDERQQKDTIKNLEKVAQSLLKKVAIVIQEGDSPSLHAKLVDYSAKDGFSVKLSATKNEEHALLLYKLQGHEVIVTTVDTTSFNGKRKEHKVDLDQAEIPFADAKPKPAPKPVKTPPADDSDLADPDNPPAPDAPVVAGPETPLEPAKDAQSAPVDATDPNPNATDRLFNAMFSEWLSADGVTWTEDEGQAGAWEPEKADEIATAALSAERPNLWVYPIGTDPQEGDEPDFVATPPAADPAPAAKADESFEESAEEVAKRNAKVTGNNYDDVFPNND